MKNIQSILFREDSKEELLVTDVSHACGLGSSSYFGRIFREYAHCTPLEYRKKWQDSDR